MSKQKLFYSLVVVVAIIIGISLLIQIKSGTKFVVPENINLQLNSSINNNERVPVIILYGGNYGGCDNASDIKTTETYTDEKLSINIVGYYFTKGKGDICPAVILPIRGEIIVDINWLKRSTEKIVAFVLGGKENKYTISYNQQRVRLNPIEISNVSLREQATLETILYPIDVGVLYLGGAVSADKDYRAALREFAQSKGLVPAEKVYPGIQQTQRQRFYVVVRDRAVANPYHSEPSLPLGELPNEMKVSVYLTGPIDIDF